MELISKFPEKYEFINKYVMGIRPNGPLPKDKNDTEFVPEDDHITYTDKIQCTLTLKSGRVYTITACTPRLVAAVITETKHKHYVEPQLVIVQDVNLSNLLDAVEEWIQQQHYLNSVSALGVPLT